MYIHSSIGTVTRVTISAFAANGGRCRRRATPVSWWPTRLASEARKARIASSAVATARVMFGPGTLGWVIERFISSDDYRRRAYEIAGLRGAASLRRLFRRFFLRGQSPL
jgi:hypothetical protein